VAKGITKQELNNEILQELNKIEDLSKLETVIKNNIVEAINEVKYSLDSVDTQLADNATQITDIKAKDVEQDKQIAYLNFMSQVAGYKRTTKTDGIFEGVSYYDKNGRKLASFLLTARNSNGVYTEQTLWLYENPNSTSYTHQYKFDLLYDSDGDLIERKLKNV